MSLGGNPLGEIKLLIWPEELSNLMLTFTTIVLKVDFFVFLILFSLSGIYTLLENLLINMGIKKNHKKKIIIYFVAYFVTYFVAYLVAC